MLRPTPTLAFALALGISHILWPLAGSELGRSAAAWADDDDDGGNGNGGGGSDDNDDDGGGGDDDDDDDSGGGGEGDDDDDGSPGSPERSRNDGNRRSGSEGGGFWNRVLGQPRQEPRAEPAPAAPAPLPPESAADEIVALALSAGDLAALIAQGFSVIEERAVPGFDAVSRRLRVPSGTSLFDAREAVRALPTGQDADFNHFYRTEQGFPDNCRDLECPARLAINWPDMPERDNACGRSVAIGMIDTGINERHETFDGGQLEVTRLTPGDLDPSSAIHGTAVAALLVGDPQTRSPGLVPGSRLIAVDAFHSVGSDERVDVFTLIEALGFLAEQDIGVINLSLSGPDNGVLAEMIDRLVLEEDVVVVSAVGNLGPNAAPAYPAAYAPVIAVTAVDRDGEVYRRAVRGDHVDLAAPGVAVWTAASVSGARWKTGTSFAVPFVSAAAAILREIHPDLDAIGIGEELMRLAIDVGPPGIADVFGAGILNIKGLCGGSTL